MNSPSPSFILTDWPGAEHVCACVTPPRPLSFCGPNNIITEKLTPLKAFCQTYDDPGTHDGEFNIQLPSIQEEQTIQYHIKSGGMIQTAFVLESLLEPCSAGEVHESQSFSQCLKDQNY